MGGRGGPATTSTRTPRSLGSSPSLCGNSDRANIDLCLTIFVRCRIRSRLSCFSQAPRPAQPSPPPALPSLDKASEDNERNYFKIKDTDNNDIIVVQIAGLVARRIVCESNKDQELKQGDRIGMIRFGSRADVYYENYQPLVKVGQKAISGETLLAKK